MTLACPHPVLAAETYMGLVELGVGLIPAGGGTTMGDNASRYAGGEDDSELGGRQHMHFRDFRMRRPRAFFVFFSLRGGRF